MTEGRRLLLLALARTSIRYMAARCRVKPSTVYNWRSGQSIPSRRARLLLRDNYGIPPQSWKRLLNGDRCR
jgi:transcriptional regulator with XRE-family HTH domain